MQKKIGFALGVFFILVSLVNFLNNPIFFRMNVVGNLLLGFMFIESSFYGVHGKVMQIGSLVLTSCVMTLTNDANSLVPVITILYTVLLSHKYFPNKKYLTKYYMVLPLFTAIVHDWQIASIINNIFLYVILIGGLCIIQGDDE